MGLSRQPNEYAKSSHRIQGQPEVAEDRSEGKDGLKAKSNPGTSSGTGSGHADGEESFDDDGSGPRGHIKHSRSTSKVRNRTRHFPRHSKIRVHPKQLINQRTKRTLKERGASNHCRSPDSRSNKMSRGGSINEMVNKLQANSSVLGHDSLSNENDQPLDTQDLQHCLRGIYKTTSEHNNTGKSSKTSLASLKRHFSTMSLKDKQSLRIHLSIWFPRIFRRPSLRELQEALTQMKTHFFNRLCRVKFMDLNHELSESKAQRKLFRREALYGLTPEAAPMYISSIVPECQKRRSSVDARAASHIPRTESKSGEITPSLNIARLYERQNVFGSKDTSGLMCVENWRHNLMRFHDESSKSDHAKTDMCIHHQVQAPMVPVKAAYQIPKWFQTLVKDKSVITLYPNGKSREVWEHLTLPRRLLILPLPNGTGRNQVHEHTYVAIKEQENISSCMIAKNRVLSQSSVVTQTAGKPKPLLPPSKHRQNSGIFQNKSCEPVCSQSTDQDLCASTESLNVPSLGSLFPAERVLSFNYNWKSAVFKSSSSAKPSKTSFFQDIKQACQLQSRKRSSGHSQQLRGLVKSSNLNRTSLIASGGLNSPSCSPRRVTQSRKANVAEEIDVDGTEFPTGKLNQTRRSISHAYGSELEDHYRPQGIRHKLNRKQHTNKNRAPKISHAIYSKSPIKATSCTKSGPISTDRNMSAAESAEVWIDTTIDTDKVNKHINQIRKYVGNQTFNAKRNKRVRFAAPSKGEVNRNNSSVYGINGVFECHQEISVNDSTESREVSRASNSTATSQSQEGAGGTVMSMDGLTLELPEPTDHHIANQGTSLRNTYFLLAHAHHGSEMDETGANFETRSPDLRRKYATATSQHTSHYGKSQSTKGTTKTTDLVKQRRLSVKSTSSIAISRRQKEQDYIKYRKNILSASKNESLADFVKDAWRTDCESEPLRTPRKSLPIKPRTVFSATDHYPSVRQANPRIDHGKAWRKSPTRTTSNSSLHPNDYLCNKKRSGHKSLCTNSVHNDRSYETLCTQRRECYQSLCNKVDQYYKSVSSGQTQDKASSSRSELREVRTRTKTVQEWADKVEHLESNCPSLGETKADPCGDTKLTRRPCPGQRSHPPSRETHKVKQTQTSPQQESLEMPHRLSFSEDEMARFSRHSSQCDWRSDLTSMLSALDKLLSRYFEERCEEPQKQPPCSPTFEKPTDETRREGADVNKVNSLQNSEPPMEFKNERNIIKHLPGSADQFSHKRKKGWQKGASNSRSRQESAGQKAEIRNLQNSSVNNVGETPPVSSPGQEKTFVSTPGDGSLRRSVANNTLTEETLPAATASNLPHEMAGLRSKTISMDNRTEGTLHWQLASSSRESPLFIKEKAATAYSAPDLSLRYKDFKAYGKGDYGVLLRPYSSPPTQGSAFTTPAENVVAQNLADAMTKFPPNHSADSVMANSPFTVSRREQTTGMQMPQSSSGCQTPAGLPGHDVTTNFPSGQSLNVKTFPNSYSHTGTQKDPICGFLCETSNHRAPSAAVQTCPRVQEPCRQDYRQGPSSPHARAQTDTMFYPEDKLYLAELDKLCGLRHQSRSLQPMSQEMCGSQRCIHGQDLPRQLQTRNYPPSASEALPAYQVVADSDFAGKCNGQRLSVYSPCFGQYPFQQSRSPDVEGSYGQSAQDIISKVYLNLPPKEQTGSSVCREGQATGMSVDCEKLFCEPPIRMKYCNRSLNTDFGTFQNQRSPAQERFHELCEQLESKPPLQQQQRSIQDERDFVCNQFTDAQLQALAYVHQICNSGRSSGHEGDINNIDYSGKVKSRAERFDQMEVDNRLLDPDKKFYNPELLSQPCRQDTQAARADNNSFGNRYRSQSRRNGGKETPQKTPAKPGSSLSRPASKPRMHTKGSQVDMSRKPCSDKFNTKYSRSEKTIFRPKTDAFAQTCACICKRDGKCFCGRIEAEIKLSERDLSLSASPLPTMDTICKKRPVNAGVQTSKTETILPRHVQDCHVQCTANDFKPEVCCKEAQTKFESAACKSECRNKKCQIGQYLACQDLGSKISTLLCSGSTCDSSVTIGESGKKSTNRSTVCSGNRNQEKCTTSREQYGQTDFSRALFSNTRRAEKGTECDIDRQYNHVDEIESVPRGKQDAGGSDMPCLIGIKCPCATQKLARENAPNGNNQDTYISPQPEQDCDFQQKPKQQNGNGNLKKCVKRTHFRPDLCEDEAPCEEKRRPILHIRYSSKQVGGRPENPSPSANTCTTSVGSNLKSQISEIIQKSKALQQQAIELRKQYQRGEIQPSSRIRCTELCPDDYITCELRDTENPESQCANLTCNRNIDRNINANPQYQSGDNDATSAQDKIDCMPLVPSGRSSAHSRVPLSSEMNNPRPDDLGQVIQQKRVEDQGTNSSLKDASSVSDKRWPEQQRETSQSKCKVEKESERNMTWPESGEIIVVNNEKDRSWNARPPRPHYCWTENPERCHIYTCPQNQYCYVNDPSEEAYQYIDTHFPQISQSRLYRDESLHTHIIDSHIYGRNRDLPDTITESKIISLTDLNEPLEDKELRQNVFDEEIIVERTISELTVDTRSSDKTARCDDCSKYGHTSFIEHERLRTSLDILPERLTPTSPSKDYWSLGFTIGSLRSYKGNHSRDEQIANKQRSERQSRWATPVTEKHDLCAGNTVIIEDFSDVQRERDPLKDHRSIGIFTSFKEGLQETPTIIEDLSTVLSTHDESAPWANTDLEQTEQALGSLRAMEQNFSERETSSFTVGDTSVLRPVTPAAGDAVCGQLLSSRRTRTAQNATPSHASTGTAKETELMAVMDQNKNKMTAVPSRRLPRRKCSAASSSEENAKYEVPPDKKGSWSCIKLPVSVNSEASSHGIEELPLDSNSSDDEAIDINICEKNLVREIRVSQEICNSESKGSVLSCDPVLEARSGSKSSVSSQDQVIVARTRSLPDPVILQSEKSTRDRDIGAVVTEMGPQLQVTTQRKKAVLGKPTKSPLTAHSKLSENVRQNKKLVIAQSRTGRPIDLTDPDVAARSESKSSISSQDHVIIARARSLPNPVDRQWEPRAGQPIDPYDPVLAARSESKSSISPQDRVVIARARPLPNRIALQGEPSAGRPINPEVIQWWNSRSGTVTETCMSHKSHPLHSKTPYMFKRCTSIAKRLLAKLHSSSVPHLLQSDRSESLCKSAGKASPLSSHHEQNVDILQAGKRPQKRSGKIKSKDPKSKIQDPTCTVKEVSDRKLPLDTPNLQDNDRPSIEDDNLSSQSKASDSCSWQTCLLACGEVTEASEEKVVIEGAYVSRSPAAGEGTSFSQRSSPKLLKPNAPDECRVLDYMYKDVLPYRLELVRKTAEGNSIELLTGTYTRQLLTSDLSFTWTASVSE